MESKNARRGFTQSCFPKGFTLIELLVVVLIIGILAAVAVPQYQKAVMKSRNAELKQIAKAVADAERAYYLANGKYAANFSELDIDLPLNAVKTTSGGSVGICNVTVQGTDSIRVGNGFYVILHTTLSNLKTMTPSVYWNTGKYQCAGFGIGLAYSRSNDTRGKLHCRENNKSSLYTAAKGAFCKGIENAVFKGSDGPWDYYELP